MKSIEVDNIPWVSSGVKASIDASATTQNPSPCIDDTIGWNERLGSRGGGSVCQGDVEVAEEGDIDVWEGNPSSLQHQHTEVLRQCGR